MTFLIRRRIALGLAGIFISCASMADETTSTSINYIQQEPIRFLSASNFGKNNLNLECQANIHKDYDVNTQIYKIQISHKMGMNPDSKLYDSITSGAPNKIIQSVFESLFPMMEKNKENEDYTAIEISAASIVLNEDMMTAESCIDGLTNFYNFISIYQPYNPHKFTDNDIPDSYDMQCSNDDQNVIVDMACAPIIPTIPPIEDVFQITHMTTRGGMAKASTPLAMPDGKTSLSLNDCTKYTQQIMTEQMSNDPRLSAIDTSLEASCKTIAPQGLITVSNQSCWWEEANPLVGQSENEIICEAQNLLGPKVLEELIQNIGQEALLTL